MPIYKKASPDTVKITDGTDQLGITSEGRIEVDIPDVINKVAPPPHMETFDSRSFQLFERMLIELKMISKKLDILQSVSDLPFEDLDDFDIDIT